MPRKEPCYEGSKPCIEVLEMNSPFGQKAQPILRCVAAAREPSAVPHCDAVSAHSADERRSALAPRPVLRRGVLPWGAGAAGGGRGRAGPRGWPQEVAAPWHQRPGAWHGAVFCGSLRAAKPSQGFLWCSTSGEMIVFACYKLNSPIREL